MSKPSNDGKIAWLRAYARGLLNGNLFQELAKLSYQEDKSGDPHPQTRFTWTEGPMIYLGQQICKRMEKGGWPSRIAYGYRTPEHQNRLYNTRTPKGKRVTYAKAYQSPHNFFEAVDIVHKGKGWDAPKEYWEALAQCVRVVSQEYNVALVHGHHWKMVDSAHIELADWREVRKRQQRLQRPHWPPTKHELAERFEEVLPLVWRSKGKVVSPPDKRPSPETAEGVLAAQNRHRPER